MRYFIIFLILFCGFVFLPVYAQHFPNIEFESKDPITYQENKTHQTEIKDSGLFTKNKLETQMLALGQEAQIIFLIEEDMVGDTTKAVLRYQVLLTQDDPFDTKNIIEINLSSLKSREITIQFNPQEIGGFFLRQEILYNHEDCSSPASSNSVMQFHVVGKFNKVTDEDGLCQKSELVRLFKPNFSTNVCVTPTTALKLMGRWF